MTSSENNRTCPQYEMKRLPSTANQNQQHHILQKEQDAVRKRETLYAKPNANKFVVILRMVEVKPNWFSWSALCSTQQNPWCEFYFNSDPFQSRCMCKNCTFSHWNSFRKTRKSDAFFLQWYMLIVSLLPFQLENHLAHRNWFVMCILLILYLFQMLTAHKYVHSTHFEIV